MERIGFRTISTKVYDEDYRDEVDDVPGCLKSTRGAQDCQLLPCESRIGEGNLYVDA